MLDHHEVVGLLRLTYRVEEREVVHFVGRGCGGANRPTVTNTSRCYYAADVQREKEFMTRAREQLGWRVQLTNASQAVMSLSESVARYREG